MSSEETLSEIKVMVEDWADKHDHESCWFYFEILSSIAKKLGVVYNKEPTISRAEFKEGCRIYQIELYGPEHEFVKSEMPDYLL